MTFTNIFELASFLSECKSGGRFTTLICETKVKLNKFPTDKTKEKVRIDETLVFTKQYQVTYNFGADYETAMSKVLGEEYHASAQPNRIHLVPNVLAQNTESGKCYLIYINGQIPKESTKYLCNGVPATDEQIAYMRSYMPEYKPKNEVLKYRNVGIENVREIHLNKEKHKVEIIQQVVKRAE